MLTTGKIGSPKEKFWGLAEQEFYRSDAILDKTSSVKAFEAKPVKGMHKHTHVC